MFENFINIFFLADYHQVLIRPEYMIGSRKKAGDSIKLGAYDAAVQPCPEIHLPDSLSDPFPQRRNFINRIFLIQLNVVKHIIGGVSHGYPLRDILLRIHYRIRAVAQQKLRLDITGSLADYIFGSRFL